MILKDTTKLKLGLALAGLTCMAGAAITLVLLQKRREEQVYHEAELKAMDELEHMMRMAQDYESDCGGCCEDDGIEIPAENCTEETPEDDMPVLQPETEQE